MTQFMQVKLFPRLSIDSTRRVRQLSHTLNGQICSKSGKRTAKHMPRIAGPWLAGTYDNDRGAGRAAQDALKLVFPTPEKVLGVRKAFHQQILEYCEDAILHETVQTLSDERAVSADDAQATYARVVATSLSVVSSLINELPADDVVSQQHLYEQFFASKIWEFAYHSDNIVRRSLHRLVRLCATKQPGLVEINLKATSTAYIYKGLPSDQTGSSLDFVQTLDHLTGAFPTIWTEAYSGKKSATSRLRSFLKHGSQAGPAEFWPALTNLVRKLPEEVFPSSFDEAADLLTGARDGVSKKEDRFNASHSWQAYAAITDVIARYLPEQDQEKLIDNHVLPIVQQYLRPSPQTSDWAIAGARPALVVSRVAQVHQLPSVLERELPSLADQIIELVKLSQPEQSKDYEKSQKEVTAAGERWAALQRELLQGNYDLPDSLIKAFLAQDDRLMKECFTLLTARNGKPYGAAATVDELLRTCGDYLKDDASAKAILKRFTEEELPDLLSTPSQCYLTYCLYALKSEPKFEQILQKALHRLVSVDDTPESKEQLLRSLFGRQTPEEVAHIALSSKELQELFVSLSTPGSDGKVACPALLADLLPSGTVAADTLTTVLGSLSASLVKDTAAPDALRSLDRLASSSRGDVSKFMADGQAGGDQLLSNILRLEQAQDEQVADLAHKLSSLLSLASNDVAGVDKFSVVRQNLETVSTSSLSVSSLFDLLHRLIGPEGKAETPERVLPKLELWSSSLQSVMAAPKPSMSLMSPFGGAVYLVQDSPEAPKDIPHDAEGRSQALRIAMYVARLLASTDIATRLESGDDGIASMLALLVMTVLVAEDNMSIPGTNGLWIPGPEQDTEVLDFISEANVSISKILSSAGEAEPASYKEAVARLAEGSTSASMPMTYYSALASSRISSNLFEAHGSSADVAKASEDTLRHLRKNGDLFDNLSQIAGYAQPLSGSQYLSRVCNEIVADLTGLSLEQNEVKALKELITLNMILASQEDIVGAIAKQRLIFLVKHVVPWLGNGVSNTVRAEVAKALNSLLPAMGDIYGEDWSRLLSEVTATWSGAEVASADDNGVALTNATLRLYATLQKLSKGEDASDDIGDALKEHQAHISRGLLNLLKNASDVSDESHQPLMLTNELLARQISHLPATQVESAEELYPLMYTQSRAVQQAAFSLLHVQIPAAQEQISFDAALENKTAHLPDELLSLILEAPTLDSLADASFDRAMPISLQSYLYSWRLLFDHFTNSSYKVKTDYIDQLKDGTYLSGLLSLTFDFLGHTRGKPIDASRFDVTSYQADMEESPERDVQWLLSHLFYLSLTHLPSLVKSYYLDIRSRQTSLAVESWAAKYISPLITTASLQAVSEWAEKSVKEDPEYEKMNVKVGMRSKEINVSYMVDEQTMAIKVVLPEAYPLAAAQVVGVRRVAVKEEKWQSWLRNCQGVITFSVCLSCPPPSLYYCSVY